MDILQINHMSKAFSGLEVLKDISLTVKEGEVVSVIGPSGSGKSTLLRCAAMLEKMDGGDLIYMGEYAARDHEGKSVYAGKSELKKFHHYFGLVFQSFNLFPHYSVMKNIVDAPMSVDKISKAEAYDRADKLLRQLGLSDKRDAYPYQLSGGQQQRVAIGRALIMKPALVLADEPTGNLDSQSSRDVMDMLCKASRHYRQTVLMITHNMNLTSMADRVFRVADGTLEELGGVQQ